MSQKNSQIRIQISDPEKKYVRSRTWIIFNMTMTFYIAAEDKTLSIMLLNCTARILENGELIWQPSRNRDKNTKFITYASAQISEDLYKMVRNELARDRAIMKVLEKDYDDYRLSRSLAKIAEAPKVIDIYAETGDTKSDGRGSETEVGDAREESIAGDSPAESDHAGGEWHAPSDEEFDSIFAR